MNRIDIVLYLHSIQPSNANILENPTRFISYYYIMSFCGFIAKRIMK